MILAMATLIGKWWHLLSKSDKISWCNKNRKILRMKIKAVVKKPLIYIDLKHLQECCFLIKILPFQYQKQQTTQSIKILT